MVAAPARLNQLPPASPASCFVRLQSGAWLQAFIVFQIACQLAVLSSVSGPVRPFIRVASFAASLVLLAVIPNYGRAHPAARPARWVLGIVALSLFHPTTNSLLSGSAQALMYLAILAPLFWVPRLQIGMAALRHVLLLLWTVHTLGSGFGVLQAYFPGKFQPTLSPVILAKGQDYVQSLYIVTATGERTLRPMGLSDMPGGAASAGFYAVLLGLIFFLSDRRTALRIPAFLGMVLGLMSLYLSQVRSILVMLIVCVLGFCGVLAWRGERVRLAVVSALLPVVVILSFTWAIAIGGQSVTGRLGTLVQNSPQKVYYTTRGFFLKYTIEELLPKYPLGAGLGRWGMMNAYFGDNSNPDRSSIWAEIQWTGWLLDGGVPLILAYVITLILAFRTAFRISLMNSPGDLWLWGAALFAYNLGALAFTFDYAFFISQPAMEFWTLNAALFAAARGMQRHPEQARS